MSNSTTIEISILGKTYNVAAPSSEQVESLKTAARALDDKMQATRAQNQTMSAEKLAVMIALNSMHELIELQNEKNHADMAVQTSLDRINAQLDAVVS